MSYDWKIELDSVDITDKVARFDIAADLSQYCRELTVEIADPDFYDDLDFSVLPSAPLLEVFTMIDAAWVSQGKFYMERPALSSDINQDIINGLWGRGETARLGAPFAPRVSKMWTTDTTFLSIVAEMCELAGLDWDDSQCSIDDFYVFAYTYQAENAYPIDVISELCELAGAIATADRAGDLIITAIDYAPTVADVTIDDDDWAAIGGTPEWPDFGNRVRIIPAGSLASYSVQVYAPSVCLPADGVSLAKLYARVSDADGLPVAGAVVSWSSDAADAALQYATSNTLETIMPPEELQADNMLQFTLALPPSAILGVYAYADHARRENLALVGYSIDGTVVTLGAPLTYCDQSLRVFYMTAGVAINYLQAGDTAEDVTVTANVEEQRGEVEIYIGNGCRCPAALSLDAIPRSVEIGHTAQLIAYAEEGGGPITDGRLVRVWERTALGALSWTTARLGSVGVTNEPADAVNEISGVSQCTIKRFAVDGTISVYRADIDGNPTGADIYSAHAGKVVDLSAALATGTGLIVRYTARGAALNYFAAGDASGTAYFRASMVTNREAPLEAETSLQITDPTDPTSGSTGDDYEGGAYGGSGGSDGELDTEWALGCTLDDGSVVQCDNTSGDDWASSQSCCVKDGVVGCWPRSECDDSQPQFDCAPANVSDNPEAPADERFGGALESGCTCEEACRAEINVFGTTQGYDDGSYRTIDDILEQDEGITYQENGDNAAYWEARGEVEADALADCLADCQGVGLQWAPGNPDTINSNSSVALYVLYGRGPFSWSVAGDGFTLEYDSTELRGNILHADEDSCGSATITVTDANGDTVTGSVRNVDNGAWAQTELDPVLFGAPDTIQENGTVITLTKTEGKYRQVDFLRRYGGASGFMCLTYGDPCGAGDCYEVPGGSGTPALLPGSLCSTLLAADASGDWPCCYAYRPAAANDAYCQQAYDNMGAGVCATFEAVSQSVYEWVCI